MSNLDQDLFYKHTDRLDSPASYAQAATPSGSNVTLSKTSRALYTGGGGDIAVTMSSGTDVVFAATAPGTVIPIRVTVIRSTGTTATGVVALW